MAIIYHICVPTRPQIIYLKLQYENASLRIKVYLELEIYGLTV